MNYSLAKHGSVENELCVMARPGRAALAKRTSWPSYPGRATLAKRQCRGREGGVHTGQKLVDMEEEIDLAKPVAMEVESFLVVAKHRSVRMEDSSTQ